MRFGVLGPLEARTDEGTPVAVPGGQLRALIANLVVHAGEPVPVDRLIDDLWGSRLPSHPVATLQVKISQLRRVLEDAEPDAGSLLQLRSRSYVLDAEPDAVDALRFEALVVRSRVLMASRPDDAASLLGEALSLWRGPALADFVGEPFARGATARLEELRLAAVEDHVELMLALGRHTSVIGDLEALVREHPLRERLRAQQMRALYRSGRQIEALETYERFRTELVEQLGLDPGPELARVQHAILVQDPALDAPATIAASGARTNLPARRDSFVGRQEAMDELRQMLKAGRLVTLTGPGGVGKTRLAVEVAAELLDDARDGAWLLELAPFEPGTPDLIDRLTDALLAVLGVRSEAPRLSPGAAEPAAPGERISKALRDRRALIVLDNCEHVVDEAAAFADLILREALGTRILATSREPLRLAGEAVWVVSPLEVPGEGVTYGPGVEPPSAVRLFVERAAAVRSGVQLDESDAEAIFDLCRKLDGLPLALELAAARTRGLPVKELAARLDDRLRLLAGGRRDAPTRQQALRATIEWSWQLLTGGEQAALRRLAVFTGGFSLDAAEAVAAGEQVAAREVVDVLAQLVDRSLVVLDAKPGRARYSLLETIAAFALDRLDAAGETEATRHRHARLFADLAELADRGLRGQDQQLWDERLEVEAGNLRAALEWALSGGNPVLGVRTAAALGWWWYQRGRHAEGMRFFTLAVAAGGGAPPVETAKALSWLCYFGSLDSTVEDPMRHGRRALDIFATVGEPTATAHAQALIGSALYFRGEVAYGAQLVTEALVAFSRLGDSWGRASALTTHGWATLRQGDLQTARRDGEESLALFRQLGDRSGQARAAELLGFVAEVRGEYEQAARLHRAALRLAEELGLGVLAVQELGRLGRLALASGDDAASVELNERALRLAGQLAFEPGLAFAHVGLALAARRQGRLDSAEQHLGAALGAHRAAGFHSGLAFVLAQLGGVAEQRGDLGEALDLHRQGLASARASVDPRAVALALEGLASAHAARADHRQAAILLGKAAAMRASAGAPLPTAERADIDRVDAACRRQLGDAAFVELSRRGASMDLDRCLELEARAVPG